MFVWIRESSSHRTFYITGKEFVQILEWHGRQLINSSSDDKNLFHILSPLYEIINCVRRRHPVLVFTPLLLSWWYKLCLVLLTVTSQGFLSSQQIKGIVTSTIHLWRLNRSQTGLCKRHLFLYFIIIDYKERRHVQLVSLSAL